MTLNVSALCLVQGMWSYVSDRGTCVEPSGLLPVPEVVCSENSDCNDGIACTTDTCNAGTGQCSNVLDPDCSCGNLVCEAGESATCIDDCGPFDMRSTPGEGYWGNHNTGAGGFMIDVQALNDISVQSLTFYALDPTWNDNPVNCNVNLYTASEGWSGKQTNSAAWTKIVDGQAFPSAQCECVQFYSDCRDSTIPLLT